jgi:hypothetical protein
MSALYGVVIVSYIAPYLPEILHSQTLSSSLQVLCHSSRAGFVTSTITAHHYGAVPLLSRSLSPSQAVHPDMLHMFHIYRHIAFAPPACVQISRSSLSVFWGSLVGASSIYSHIRALYYSCTHYLHRSPCEFLLLSFTTSGGMFLTTMSLLKALLPD